jgi:hypothetical protein
MREKSATILVAKYFFVKELGEDRGRGRMILKWI